MNPTDQPVCLYCGFSDCSELSTTQRTPVADTASVTKKSVSVADALSTAAEWLQDAGSILVCGLNCLDSESQFTAWKIADVLQATVDTTLTNSNRAALQTFQRYGKVTATYGEIKNRCDLLVLWDCALRSQAPCIADLLASDRVQRKVVFVGDPSLARTEQADFVLPILDDSQRKKSIALTYLIRAQLAGINFDPNHASDHGFSNDEVDKLYQILTNCKYGTLFFGQHDTDSEFDLETESLMLMVRELNSKTRFVGSKIRKDINGLGAETVLTLAGGFPQATDLSRGWPRYAGLNNSAESRLTDNDAEVVLMFGQANSHDLTSATLSGLQQARVIQFASQPDSFADLFIGCPTLADGNVSGMFYRSDGAMLQGNEKPTSTVIDRLLANVEVVSKP